MLTGEHSLLSFIAPCRDNKFGRDTRPRNCIFYNFSRLHIEIEPTAYFHPVCSHFLVCSLLGYYGISPFSFVKCFCFHTWKVKLDSTCTPHFLEPMLFPALNLKLPRNCLASWEKWPLETLKIAGSHRSGLYVGFCVFGVYFF